MSTRTQLFILLTAFLFSNSQYALAVQEPVEKQPKTDLALKSGISLELSGPKVVNEFMLVDDLGFEYDTMSFLRNGKVREEIGLTDEQYQKMKTRQKQMTDLLYPLAMKSLTASESEDFGQTLVAQFKAAQSDLEKNMSDEQLVRLSQLRNQFRLQKFGAAKVINSRYFQTELKAPAEQIESVQQKVEILVKTKMAKTKSLYRSLNEKTVASLPTKKRRQLREAMKKEFYDQFISQNPFVAKPKKRLPSAPNDIPLMDLLADGKIREKVEISDSQYSDIASLKKEFDHRLKAQTEELLSGPGKILSVSQRGKQLSKLNSTNKAEFEKRLRTTLLDHQLKKLIEICIEVETRTNGTVICICTGTLRNQAKLSDSEAKKAYQTATRLYKEMSNKLEMLDKELDAKVLGLVPTLNTAEKVGMPFDFEFK